MRRGLVLGQPLGGRASASAKPLSNASPMRSQLAAVSEIKNLLVGVERLILAPQLAHGIASFLTKTVTICSVCCPHFWQRIRSIVLGQPLGGRASASAKPLSNASPMRSQLAAVSEIKNLLVGVERLILAPQLAHGIASFLTKTVTICSVCCPHFWQRIRSIVQSEVENFIKASPRGQSRHGDQPYRHDAEHKRMHTTNRKLQLRKRTYIINQLRQLGEVAAMPSAAGRNLNLGSHGNF